MQFFISLVLCLSSMSAFLVNSQELTFVQHDEWGSQRYLSVTKIKEHYYASSYNRAIDVLDPSVTGPESLKGQFVLGEFETKELDAFEDDLVVVTSNGLSIYSINNTTEFTLEYSLEAETLGSFSNSIFISDKLFFIDRNHSIFQIGKANGKYILENVIDATPEEIIVENSIEHILLDDNYIYYFYQSKNVNQTITNIHVDKYNLSNNNLVKHYTIEDRSFYYVDKIDNGQFVINKLGGLLTLDIRGDEALVKETYDENYYTKIAYKDNYVYAQAQAQNIFYTFKIDASLNISLHSTYDFPQYHRWGHELIWLDNKIVHGNNSTGLLELAVTAGVVVDSNYLYNQGGGLGRGVFIDNNYYAPREHRIDILTFNDDKKAVKESDFEQYVSDIYVYKNDFLNRYYSGVAYNSLSTEGDWKSDSHVYNSFYGAFVFNDDFAFALGENNGTVRLKLDGPLSFLESTDIIATPEAACESEPLVILPTKLIRFDSCADLVHIYNSTEDDFSFIKSLPYTEFDYIERIPSKGEYFYIVDSTGIHVHTLTEANELSETSLITHSVDNSVMFSEVHDNYLFVLTQFQMFIYDVTNAASPRYISTVDYSDNYSTPPKVSLSGNKLALTFYLISKVRFYELNRAPAAQKTHLIVDEDSSINFIDNFIDAEGDQLSFEIITEPSSGSVNFDNGAHYVPSVNFYGADEFTIKVSDEHGNAIEQIMTTFVTEIDDMPLIEAIAVDVVHEGSYSGTLPVVDVDGDSMQYTLVSDVTNGVLTLASNGEYSYSANDGFSGEDFFTFEGSDGKNSIQSMVTFDVQIAPSESSSGGSIHYFYIIVLFMILFFRVKSKVAK